MGDKNLEDGDIESAPKLIQVVFEHCKGQVDHWVEPYIRVTIERLRRAEKSYLKCLLVQVVTYFMFKLTFVYVSLLTVYSGWYAVNGSFLEQ